MNVKILNRFTGLPIIEIESESVISALLEYLETNKNLSGADLRGGELERGELERGELERGIYRFSLYTNIFHRIIEEINDALLRRGQNMVRMFHRQPIRI